MYFFGAWCGSDASVLHTVFAHPLAFCCPALVVRVAGTLRQFLLFLLVLK